MRYKSNAVATWETVKKKNLS
jgi:hypothetical protein